MHCRVTLIFVKWLEIYKGGRYLLGVGEGTIKVTIICYKDVRGFRYCLVRRQACVDYITHACQVTKPSLRSVYLFIYLLHRHQAHTSYQ